MPSCYVVVTCTGSDYVYFLAKQGTTDEGVDRRHSLSSYIEPTERLQMIVVEDIWSDARSRNEPKLFCKLLASALPDS